MVSWNDKSKTSQQQQQLTLDGILGAVTREDLLFAGQPTGRVTNRPNAQPKARFRLLVNWMSREDDPPSSSVVMQTGLANSEALLSLQFPVDRSGMILPVRRVGGAEIGFTTEVLDFPEHADELQRDLEHLQGCRVSVTVRLVFYRFTPRATPGNANPSEVRGCKLRLLSLRAEGVEFAFATS